MTALEREHIRMAALRFHAGRSLLCDNFLKGDIGKAAHWGTFAPVAADEEVLIQRTS